MRVSLIGPTVLALTLAPAPIFACKCASPTPDAPKGQALWEATRRADVVFEGKVESAEPKWRLINAQVGEVIPADIEEGEPAIQMTFEVLRNYSQADQKHLKLRTGFGGGDCGFPFEVGENISSTHTKTTPAISQPASAPKLPCSKTVSKKSLTCAATRKSQRPPQRLCLAGPAKSVAIWFWITRSNPLMEKSSCFARGAALSFHPKEPNRPRTVLFALETSILENIL
jgi:hypothetical protein